MADHNICLLNDSFPPLIDGVSMDVRWIVRLRAAFTRVYGEKRGTAVCNVVVPAVLGDFRKAVLAAADGAPVREQYRTDDRKTDVTLTGHRETRGGQAVCVIDRIAVGGAPIDLGGGLVV